MKLYAKYQSMNSYILGISTPFFSSLPFFKTVEHFLIPLTQLSNLYLSRTIPVKVKAIVTDYTCESKGYCRHTNDGLSYPTAAVCPFSAATYDFKTLSSLLADKTDGI